MSTIVLICPQCGGEDIEENIVRDGDSYFYCADCECEAEEYDPYECDNERDLWD